VREIIISGQLTSGEFIRPGDRGPLVRYQRHTGAGGASSRCSEGLLKVKPRRGFPVSPLSSQDIRDTFEAQALLAGVWMPRPSAGTTTGWSS